MSSTTSSARRQRASMACEPCRDRKRKCGGGQPCDLCRGFGYECYYRDRPRQRRTQARNTTPRSRQHSPVQANEAVISGAATPAANDVVQQTVIGSLPRAAQSNSGLAFARTFALAIDPNNAPPMQMLAWNLFLDERRLLSPTMPANLNLSSILPLGEMKVFVESYFAKVNPCYGFLDHDLFLHKVHQRWSSNDADQTFDAVLCGVATLGSLFSGPAGMETETALFNLLKAMVDGAVAETPSADTAMACLLRAIYLRLTGRPDEAWMASCVALHAIEAAEMHCSVDSSVAPRRAGQDIDPDVCRRVLGIARHTNVWLSFDLARSPVRLQDATEAAVTPRAGEYTPELLSLLPYTYALDPAKPMDGPQLASTFREVLDSSHTQPPSILAQCNLMLCLYRRLYYLGWQFASDVLDKAMILIQRGVGAVHMTLESKSPWHHVANIPFQCLYMLLAIDTPQTFALLADVMSCLFMVDQQYRTKATNDALCAARALLYAHQKRREALVRRHTDMLNLYPVPEPSHLAASGDIVPAMDEDFTWINDFMSGEGMSTWGMSQA